MFDSFFAKLDEKFLSIMFDGLLCSKYEISYVFEKDGEIAGFITASTNTKKLFNEILKKRMQALLGVILAGLFRNPHFLCQLVESFFYSKKTLVNDTHAELLFITIEPRYRKRKLSKELIKTVLDQLHKMSVFKVKVTTQRKNYVVNKLLEGLQFKQVRSFSFYGKVNLVYEVALADDRKYI
ncbi:MAG: GNAT family N-acetyltransferase [Candidatus Omnitrophica bacterium]|nr:GNAT family N-acetyltransferase [Candidatus Omnitrophota bacterium]